MDMREYDIWIEGFAATGNHQRAQYLGKHKGFSFEDACKAACIARKWDMSSYDEKRNSYWGCKFFDNEKGARASFG
jgi:hypothetical protein